mgnify:CR=1 FL=1
MPYTRKVWIDEDGDGEADAHGEIVVPEVEEVVEKPAPKKRATKKKVVRLKKGKRPGDAEARRRRHMGF